METKGPLDVAREINERAADLDELAKIVEVGDETELAYLQAQAKELEADHPLIKQDVVVYGRAVEADFQRVVSLLHGVSSPEHQAQTGRYAGLMICNTYDSDTGEPRHRVAHAVHTGSSDLLPDGIGNFHQTIYMNYVLTAGSEIVPVLPVNAHSMDDLRGDPVVRAVDEIMGDQDKGSSDKITALGVEVNDILAGEDNVDENLDHQRASYINSFGIHPAARLVVRDVLVGDQGDTSGEYELASLADDIVISPDMFDIMPGYEVPDGSDEFVICGTQELFVRAELRKVHLLLIPLKNVIRVDLLR